MFVSVAFLSQACLSSSTAPIGNTDRVARKLFAAANGVVTSLQLQYTGAEYLFLRKYIAAMRRCLSCFYLIMPAVLALGLLSCTPTPRKVNELIGRGRPREAVRQLSELLNRDGDITSVKLDTLLQALTQNRHFTLEIADDLFDRLKPDGRSAILKWYINLYLEKAEKLLTQGKFREARAIWIHHQKVRNAAFPDFQEATPVLGIIDLREAEFHLAKGRRAQARQLFESARIRLSRRVAFDLIQQFSFANMVQDLRRRLYATPARPVIPKKTARKG